MGIKQKLKNNYIIVFLRTILKYKHYLPLNIFPHGHFYSPIVSKNDIDQFQDIIWEEKKIIKGIDLNNEVQLHYLKEVEKEYRNLSFSEEKTSPNDYYYNNGSYEYTDGVTLGSFMKFFKPNRIIEIGSGFSSLLMINIKE